MTNTLDQPFAPIRPIIAVVGLSDKPHRTSHAVARYMQNYGYRIIPVNPRCAGTHILGEHCHATLLDAQAALKGSGEQIGIVNVFRRAEDMMPVARDAIAIGAPCLWMQLGIANEEAANEAREAGMHVIMDRCIKIDHAMGITHGVL